MEPTIAILMVDDDEDDRNLFCDALKIVDGSIQCHTATDGLNALDFLKKCETLPDFIFLDLNMPRMDGIQCLTKLKENKRFGAIPVIIYSTSDLDGDVNETMRLGAVHFIIKPTHFDDICNEIALVLKGNWKESTVSRK